jgi:hypothetical protein
MVVRDLGGAYEIGRLRWAVPPRYEPVRPPFESGLSAPVARQAARSHAGARQFLIWSRFPFAELAQRDGLGIVHFDDARYATPERASWAGVSVVLPSRGAGGR